METGNGIVIFSASPNGLDMKSSHFVMTLSLVSSFVALCVLYIDIPVALTVQRIIGGSVAVKYTHDIPDLLLILVIIMTTFSLLGYIIGKLRKWNDATTMFFQLVACSMPVSYVAKSLTKLAFGRINTREWLLRPDLYSFHWFHGDRNFHGFPSGHTMIFATLSAAVWRYFPRYRNFCGLFMFFLSTALVITNYHFFSDVIAGIYFGILVESCIYHLLHLTHRGEYPAEDRQLPDR
jgi:membrane-associated phospholipid phosphatase